MFPELDTPCVLIDIDRVDDNLKRAQAHADKRGVALRPHIKTHKIPRFAQRAVDLGAVGITVQKLGEAEVMADAGLKDLFLPYNIVGEKKLARLRVLNERVALKVTADSPNTVSGYAATFADAAKSLTVLVECDTGMGRCGVQTPDQALALARQISLSSGLRFGGLMTFPAVGGFDNTETFLTETKALLDQAGLSPQVVTTGGTPGMWEARSTIANEYRPGTYIYNDLYQVSKGAATFEHCALTVLATVVSRPTAKRIVIDAGSKTLTSDIWGQDGFGMILSINDQVIDWQSREFGRVITSLSEEHGVIEMPVSSDMPRIGDRLRILPNHACVVSNLFDNVHLVKGDTFIETIPVAARGRVD